MNSERAFKVSVRVTNGPLPSRGRPNPGSGESAGKPLFAIVWSSFYSSHFMAKYLMRHCPKCGEYLPSS